LLKRRKIYR